jgi:thiamine-phosphate pyrophosphorylase
MLIPRFYPILDTNLLRRRGLSAVEAAVQILDAGARILQLRHKEFFTGEVLDQAVRIAELCRGAGAALVINDRADIAAMLNAGVHLGQEDLAPSAARRVLKTGTIGFSTHNATQLLAAAAEPADYLAIGPVYMTGSKENPDPVLGLDELRRLRALAGRPLVAIGGITRVTALAVLAAGADSVAVISDLYPEDLRVNRRAVEWVSLLG